MKYTITFNQDGSSTVSPEPFKHKPGDEVTYIYPHNSHSCIGELTTIWNKNDDLPNYPKQQYTANLDFLDFSTPGEPSKDVPEKRLPEKELVSDEDRMNKIVAYDPHTNAPITWKERIAMFIDLKYDG